MRSFLAALAVCGALTAQVPTAAGRAAAGPPGMTAPPTPIVEVKPEDRGSVEGTVADQVTGAPIRKATLSLRRNQTGPNDIGASYTANSDAGGHFVISDVDPGKYFLSIEKTGYVTTRYGARTANGGGSILTVDKKQKVKDIDFKLIAHAVIIGRVLDDEGDPVANVQVQPMRFGYMRGKKQLMPGMGSNAATNDLGEFRIFGLAPGKYFLSATYRGYNMSTETQSRTEESFAQTYYPSAAGVEGAAPIEATAGAQMRGYDLRLRKSIAVAVKGRIVGSPEVKSVRNANVMLIPKSEGPFGGYIRNMSRPTNAQGDFSVTRVTPGTYIANAMLQEDGKSYFGSTTVEVGNAPLEGVVIELGTGLEVRGIVKIEGKGTLKPTDLRLNLMQRQLGGLIFGGQMQGGEVKDDGKFTYSHVPNTHFDIGAFASVGYLKSVKIEANDITDTGLDLSSAGGPVEITVVYSTDDGQIEGTVQTEQSDKAPKASIVVVPEGKRRETERYYSMTGTDQSGHFSVKRLAPGEYRVFAFDSVEYGAYMDPEWLKPFESKGEKVSIKEGGKETVQLTLIKTAQ